LCPPCIAFGIGLGGLIGVTVNYISNIVHGRDPDENVHAAAATGMLVGAAGEGMMLGAGAGVGGVRTAGTDWLTMERAGSEAEAASTISTGLLRGGRAGTQFVTDAVPASAGNAERLLALPQRPQVRMTFNVPADQVSAARTVQPRFGQPGGGTERMADPGTVARILQVVPLR
jgi:hypothetical protein